MAKVHYMSPRELKARAAAADLLHNIGYECVWRQKFGDALWEKAKHDIDLIYKASKNENIDDIMISTVVVNGEVKFLCDTDEEQHVYTHAPTDSAIMAACMYKHFPDRFAEKYTVNQCIDVLGVEMWQHALEIADTAKIKGKGKKKRFEIIVPDIYDEMKGIPGGVDDMRA